MAGELSVMTSFQARSDLSRFGSNALLLFALELKKDIDDINAVAAQALIDGSDDKSCDLVYIDPDTHTVVIAQAYFSETAKQAAPSKKAADLNQATAWLLTVDPSELPERIKPAAISLRTALNDGTIETIEIWYVHNLPESLNVKSELNAVSVAMSHIMESAYSQQKYEIRTFEVGLATLETWYRETQATISVNEVFTIKIPGGYRQSSEKWESFSTAIPTTWLYEVYKKHTVSLFSANIRDYLGSRGGDRNINNGIKQSADTQPENFWVFNNGITALVNDFEVSANEKEITITGISIVNGAQTTGSLGSLEKPPTQTAKVSARFVKCSDRDLIQSIVRYNNSQNKTASADFRSTDAIQERLRNEFSVKYPTLTYRGARRGSSTDNIPRHQNLIPSDTAAQALAAFHGRPVIAYNQKSELWESNTEYSRIFGDQTHADHIVFTYSLYNAIADYRLNLMSRQGPGSSSPLTNVDIESLEFLRYRGALHLLMAAIGACMELFLDSRITDNFILRFDPVIDVRQAGGLWTPIITYSIAFRTALLDPLKSGLGIRSSESEIQNAINQFKSYIEATREPNKQLLQHFRAKVTSQPR